MNNRFFRNVSALREGVNPVAGTGRDRFLGAAGRFAMQLTALGIVLLMQSEPPSKARQ